MMNKEIVNYLGLMKDSLVKKDKLLSEIITLTKEQGVLLGETEFDDEVFDKLIAKKSILISEINKLDEGFDLTYKRIADKVKGSPADYREPIEELQNLIRTLVDKGVEIETAARRNQTKFDLQGTKSRDKIRNSSAVTKYYSNMSGNTGESTYFLDQKK